MEIRMKKIPILVTAVLGAIIASCTADKHNEPLVKELILSASSESTPTKSTRDADGTFYWSPDDQISLFCRSGKDGGTLFRSKNDKRERVKEFYGTFIGAVPTGSTFWGIYPFNAVNAFDGECLTTEVPANQVAAEGTFADGQFISIGRSDDLSMQFYHLCGGIKFFLQEEGITRITLQDNKGTPLAGVVEVVLDKENHPAVRKVIRPESKIVLTPPEGQSHFKTGTDYFIVTLPVSFPEGFDILFEKADTGEEGVRHVDANLAIHRAKFQWSEKPFDTGVEFIPAEMELETCDIVNPEVRRYLEEVDYTSDRDYTLSYVSDYKGSDKPEPAYVTWDGGKADRIVLSTSASFDEVFQVSASASPAKVYNLIPDVVYYYRVYAGNSVLKAGRLLPVGPLRMVYGVSKNVRDLGGWKAGDKRIRYGKIYRGARLDDIQSKPDEKDVLFNTLHVGVDLDLRGLPPGSQGGSGEKNPWTSDDPILYRNIQLWHYFYPSAQQYNIPEISDGTSSEQYQYTIRTILGWLKEDKVVYFHCHGGSDRTGTLAFLIEALMGVSEEDLSKDYELTYYSGSYRKRDCSSGWFYRPMVKYIRTFAPGATIGEQVTAWAKTRHSDNVDPLTDEEIDELKAMLLE